MDPLIERVLEDSFWLVLLIAVIAFFWFHQWNNGTAHRGQSTQADDKTAHAPAHATRRVV
jgi:hypothetical protein